MADACRRGGKGRRRRPCGGPDSRAFAYVPAGDDRHEIAFGLANYDENDDGTCMKIVKFGGDMTTIRRPITLILPENMHKWKALDL